MLSGRIQISDITIKAHSDTPISIFREAIYKKFSAVSKQSDIAFNIHQFEPVPDPLTPLEPQDKNQLAKCICFHQRWVDSPAFSMPSIRKLVPGFTKDPESTQIMLAWNRAIFRNYRKNEIHYFYPTEESNSFLTPIFRARYRNLIAPLFPNFSAALIHASAVVRNNKAILFLAKDEGGKSNVVGQHDRKSVLSDDQILVTDNNGIITAHGTPFGLTHGIPEKAMLGGLFLLEKAARFELIPAKRHEVLQFLLKEQKLNFLVGPKALNSQLFNILCNACSQAKTYIMRFPKDYVDWDVIDRAME